MCGSVQMRDAVDLARVVHVPSRLVSNSHQTSMFSVPLEETTQMAFLDFFQSNAPPSPQDRLFVETNLHSLESEIVELETTLQDLHSRHSQLLSERQRHRCVLSPIRRLPAELVDEIFSYFTPHLPSDLELRISGRESRMLSRPPWFLAHICRSWRTIALSLGPLWATFDVNLSDSRLPHSGHTWMLESQRAEVDQAIFYEGGAAIQLAMDEMEMYLRLSGNTSIKVLLNVGRFAALPVLRFLLRHSWKLGELVLYHPCWLLLHHLKNMQQSYPRLRRLAIVPDYEEGIDDLQSMFSWAQAPNLKDSSSATFYSLNAEFHGRSSPVSPTAAWFCATES
uniref:F-box domain-containing protein n=1 Tax=Mycena chlorophos TaxID=658473 RepID=A0ABQ0L614_MYCCL|nr:predicted protein [Mycena chlorophos]